MEYSAQIYTSTNLNLEKEVIDIIKAGHELQRPALTVSDDILNNYFINKAIFIDKSASLSIVISFISSLY